MDDTIFKRVGISRGLGMLVCGLILLQTLPAAAFWTANVKIVPKWGRFEQAFKSRVAYTNPPQDAVLTVSFVSPLGETNLAQGFWDGGKVWRVRFSPDQPGRWKYRTVCSDRSNSGLNQQSGYFICTAATGLSRFSQHGLVEVSADHRHLEYSDRTPFFWLADTAWNGARVSRPLDWEIYASIRGMQHFTVVQWSVAPGGDLKDQTAFTGSPDHILINPEFFKRLDTRVQNLREAGLLSAINPLREFAEGNPISQMLTEEQAILLTRYVVARYGADPVIWLLAFDGSSQPQAAERWKRIGRAVFSGRRHAPVVVYPGENGEALDAFRSQSWVDVFGCPAVAKPGADFFRGSVAGSTVRESKTEPSRPVIVFAPCENGIVPRQHERFSTEEVRHAIYWNLFAAPMAGVSYSGWGVVNWDAALAPQSQDVGSDNLPAWRKALYLTGAKQAGYLAECLQTVDIRRLHPEPAMVAEQPGIESVDQFIVAQSSEDRDVSLAYVPQAQVFHMSLGALPAKPRLNWLNPRTGETIPAFAMVEWERSCQFATPSTNDWVLLIRPLP